MWFKKRRIYLDHASATPTLREVSEALLEGQSYYGNPGAMHAESLAAKELLQRSRERIALQLGCKARELIFTSGLTESNNLAILGFARKMAMDGKKIEGTHWIVSSFEHDSVLLPFAEIERLGGTVTHVDPDEKGIVRSESVALALRKETVFVSLCWGNNEIGTVQPLREIAAAVHEHERKHASTVLFHSDAGQAPLYISPQVHTLGVDMLSLGSGKLYGPRGIGALYLGNRVALAPIIMGGGQERGLRAGTEEPALAAGFATAFQIVSRERETEAKRLKELRDSLASKLIAGISGALINGDLKHTLPHMLNVSIPNFDPEYVVLALDREGIALSTKSACNEGEAISHVVEALLKDDSDAWRAKNTLRISLGRDSSKHDVERAAIAIIDSVNKNR